MADAKTKKVKEITDKLEEGLKEQEDGKFKPVHRTAHQLSYITNVGAGHGLICCSGNLVPFENTFPNNTRLFELKSTSAGDFHGKR